jgi:hypothetical protein
LVKDVKGGAVVEVDHIRRMIHGLTWDDDKLHFDAIVTAAAAASAFIARGIEPVVFVDTLGYGRLEFALAALQSPSATVYSLVCREPFLSLRLLRRVSGYRNASNARKFNSHILSDAARYPVIDTTWSSAARVAEQILRPDGLRT